MVPLGLRLGASSPRCAARFVPACQHGRWVRSRTYHERKGLPYPIENGLGKFLSPEALKVIAVDYQNGLLDRLNDQVRGTVLENKSVVQTVIDAARDPDKVLEFDYACEALNNSFFLESMKPPAADAQSNEGGVTDAQNSLFSVIKTQQGSLEQFKSNFGAAVLGMFSSGWLYCVVDKVGEIAFYPIFGAGTLLVRSGEYHLKRDRTVGEIIARGSKHGQPSPASATSAETAEPPTASSPASGVSQNPLSTPPPPHSRTFSTSSLARSSFSLGSIGADDVYSVEGNRPQGPRDTASKIKKIGETLYPLFCVSVHEHAWLPQYGVWGKEEYMKQFWTVLDWAKVGERYQQFTANVRE